jgi:LDH2 family malate/lactate/ureidoglycolate dehydrogenase
VPAPALREQTARILAAWGFSAAAVEAGAAGLGWADLHGIDSHGCALLPVYERWLGEGRFNRAAQPRVARESPVSALLDGDHALGFLPAKRAMELAVHKARTAGVAAIGVHRSNHFGAAGWYAQMAAQAGLIGLATTNTVAAAVVPTGAREAKFGTNPIAFAAPAAGERPFLFDMATSTVALGKLMAAAYRKEPIPLGWALDPEGKPTTDPVLGYRARLATPLGGTAELSSHKGTGLAVLVEILSAALTGADSPVVGAAPGADTLGNVGHFFLALDPALFGERDAFAHRVEAMILALRAATPADQAVPVQVAGDPEYAQAARRASQGIPVPRDLLEALQAVARRARAEWLLGAG